MSLKIFNENDPPHELLQKNKNKTKNKGKRCL